MPFLICLCLLCAPLFAQEQETLQESLTIFNFENTLPDTQFNNFNAYLKPKLEQDLQTGFAVTHSDQVFDATLWRDPSKSQLRIALYGRFEKGSESGLLRFRIRDVKGGVEEQKIIAVSYMEKEDIAQIILLKTRNFLEKSILGIVAVNSSPLGLPISLDGNPQGPTPREFFLKSGRYQLEISHENFLPFREEVSVYPGRTTKVGAEMEFKGRPTHYWFLGAAAATWEVLVLWVLERNHYRDWQAKANDPAAGFGASDHDRYRNVRVFRISLLGLSGAAWLGTGYCYFSNKLLKKKLVTQ